MKYVRETKAGKSISAWVVLKNGEEIAIIQAHYADGGTVTVNIFSDSEKDRELGVQHGYARGYGYDKLGSAMHGLQIDGVRIQSHGDSGSGFRKLRDAGFMVIQAI